MSTREAFKRWYGAVRRSERHRANGGYAKIPCDFLHARYHTYGGLGRTDAGSPHIMNNKGFYILFNLNRAAHTVRIEKGLYRGSINAMRRMRLEAGSKLP